MNAHEGQAVVRLLMHLSGSQILGEATLKRDVGDLLYAASVGVGIVVNVNTANVLHTLSLAVATGAEVPYATAAVSNFGGVA